MPEHTGEGEIKDCTGKTCTCGIGPWSDRGLCEHCGGIDLGLPALIHPMQLSARERLHLLESGLLDIQVRAGAMAREVQAVRRILEA